MSRNKQNDVKFCLNLGSLLFKATEFQNSQIEEEFVRIIPGFKCCPNFWVIFWEAALMVIFHKNDKAYEIASTFWRTR